MHRFGARSVLSHSIQHRAEASLSRTLSAAQGLVHHWPRSVRHRVFNPEALPLLSVLFSQQRGLSIALSILNLKLLCTQMAAFGRRQ